MSVVVVNDVRTSPLTGICEGQLKRGRSGDELRSRMNRNDHDIGSGPQMLDCALDRL
jgi:hypothetical protein